MNRRDFIKSAAGLLLAGSAGLVQPVLELGARADAASFSVQARVNGKMLQGTRDGLILESLDGGKTWRNVANFGKHCSIAAIREQQSQIYADVVVQGHRFALKSTDARMWRTAS